MVAEEIFILCVAVVGGGLPPLLWLWFWLNEETHKEPKFLILATFVGGMITVPIALYFEELLDSFFGIRNLLEIYNLSGTYGSPEMYNAVKLFMVLVPIVFIEEIVK